MPQVDSYDEETYICKAGDSFERISEQYYHSKKYERALLLFNRNHPRAADGLQGDVPVLPEGQPIFIPPVRVLEKQFAGQIADRQAIGSQPGATAQEHVYHVRAGGELFWQIAQRTLGKGERWVEIQNLNPQFRPEQPVPAGTALRLPADARTDADTTP